MQKTLAASVICISVSMSSGIVLANPASEFREHVAPILAERCLGCHNDDDPKGELSFSSAAAAFRGSESGPILSRTDPDDSLLLGYISGDDPEMPKDSEPLTAEQVATIRRWIQNGAEWPEDHTLHPIAVTDTEWWSWLPLEKPNVPNVPKLTTWLNDGVIKVSNPIDRFVLAKLDDMGLAPSVSADRRTLIRRVFFDVVGLPPTPAEVTQFVTDVNPFAYEELVDTLLASPHYGERWARHWLDIVHYGDTHGYDKDKLRPNAWPYRDYVVRSFNEDKPYGRFVQEQIAGDALWPHTRDGIEATGFIAAGPWDFIGHAEVPESKIDGQVARNLDRDDMVTTTMNTFVSTTVQCARCHNHKFDPVTQEHYYRLQAVFAALDRADRKYDTDIRVAYQRRTAEAKRTRFETELADLQQTIRDKAGSKLDELDKRIDELKAQSKAKRPEFGYHSQIETEQATIKWVQVDLGESHALHDVTLVGAHDDFGGIGAGFGFPVRFRVEGSSDPQFTSDIVVFADKTADDIINPGVDPQTFSVPGNVRYIRVTATKLAKRSNDFIFALGELLALDSDGENVAAGKKVTALDSIEAPVRWQRTNLVDGYFFGVADNVDSQSDLQAAKRDRKALLASVTTTELRTQRAKAERNLQAVNQQIEKLPKQSHAYVGMVYSGNGAFQGRGHVGGKPRDVFVLARGDIEKPIQLVDPGTIPLRANEDGRFDLANSAPESERRVRLAHWLTASDNPLTWRSIVNRVWQYHFGQGIVDTPNDFGRMGAKPTHPELLDWLAVTFRDEGQSLKQLHRMILTSATYRQVSTEREAFNSIDAGNRFFWRMQRRALDAESIRDATLSVSGLLNGKMYGEAFRDFVLERPEHSPHYEYHKHDPDDATTHRRAIYRFLVRSQQQPFMQTLDCADPSQSVARRETSITAIQALTLLNNKFMVRMSEHFAASLAKEPNLETQVRTAYERVSGQSPTDSDVMDLVAFAREHGLANTCRVLLNLNEFLFVD